MTAPDNLQAAIRDALHAHGKLTSDAYALDAQANLHQAGMTSHCSVNVMLALEARFDVEFPDAMLTREVFGSVANIAAALQSLGVQV